MRNHGCLGVCYGLLFLTHFRGKGRAGLVVVIEARSEKVRVQNDVRVPTTRH